jgi:predicted dehydrogenase
MAETYQVGLIGFGHWGEILLRNLYNQPQITIRGVCDRNTKKLEKVQKIAPGCKTFLSADEIITQPQMEIIFIATQAKYHYDLAMQALLQGCHIFVEKPFTGSSAQALELVQLADSQGKLIMVDHTYIFSSEFHDIQRLIKSRELGEPLHYHSTRGNFGSFPSDVNVLWNLLYHDIYLLMELFPRDQIVRCKAYGKSHVVNSIEDVAIVSLEMRSGMSADFVVNLLFPEKERKIIISGRNKILMWNDLVTNKIRVFSKSARWEERDRRVEFSIQGEIGIRSTEKKEALQTEITYFIECIERRVQPINNGQNSLKIIKILEIIEEEMSRLGHLVNIS